METLLLGRFQPNGPPRRDLFGDLYEATDVISQQVVLLKCLHGDVRPGVEPGRMVQRLQELRSANLATPLLAQIAANGVLTVVSEPVSGRRLSDIIYEFRMGRRWQRHHLLRLISSVCKGLTQIHRLGLYHGGIHPNTILVNDETSSTVTLLPFSLWQALNTQAYLTGRSDELAYISQEQLRGKGDVHSDIYAVGMLLYHTFGRQAPFDLSDKYTLAEKIVWGDHHTFELLAAPSDQESREVINSELGQLHEIVGRTLQRDPNARYESMQALATVINLVAQRLDPYHVAIRLYLAKRYDAALTRLQQALQEEPNSADAYLLQGRIYGFEKGDYNQGIIAFKRALRIDPTNLTAREDQAQLHICFRHFSHAVNEYEAALRQLGTKPSYYDEQRLRAALGNVLALRNEPGDLVRALDEYERTLQVHPWFLKAHEQRAQIFRRMGDVQQAINECTTARDKILQMPTSDAAPVGAIYHLLGSLFWQIGQRDLSLRYYERAVEVNPERIDTHNTLASIYRTLGETSKAIDHLFRSLRLDPEQDSVIATFAQLLGEQQTDRKKGQTL